jgi:tetratricopeptide (TPR) repeat protein
VQFVLGALAAPLGYLVARRAVRPVWALLAGLAIASFAPLVFFEGLFLVEGLVLLALSLALAFAVCAPARVWGAALAGAALGFATLGRGSNLLLAVPFAAWFAACSPRPGRHRLRAAGVFVAGCFLVLAPLLARNAVRAGRPLLLTANAGFNAYVGNGPQATGVFVDVPGLDLQQDRLTTRYVQRELGRTVTASETSDFWMQRTRAWVRAHPGRTLWLFFWKLLLFWNRMSIPQVEGFESAAAGSVLGRPPFWHRFGFLAVGLAVAVLALATLVWQRRRADPAARVRGFIAACALTYSVSIALFFVTDRYRVPILPYVIILAAYACQVTVESLARGARRRLLALVLGFAGCFALTDPARLGVDVIRMRRDLHVHQGLRYGAARQFDAALREYGAALALDPQSADVRDGLARMLGRAGQDSLALQQFRALLQEHPDDARAWYNLGNLFARRGRHLESLGAFRRAVELEPKREAAWNHIGEAYRALGDTLRAAAAYQQALRIVPGYEQALNNLATLHAVQGDGAAAEAGWRAALASNGRYLPALVNLAILLTDTGRHPEAIVMWKRVLAVDPQNAEALRVLRELDPSAVPASLPGASGGKPGDEE